MGSSLDVQRLHLGLDIVLIWEKLVDFSDDSEKDPCFTFAALALCLAGGCRPSIDA
jgi:hypothetical protein